MPEIYYEFEIKGVPHLKILKDITTNVRVIKSVMEQITSYDEYDIVDGETPEIIAAKIYGNSLYHWIIMIVNERYDYREDFPLDYLALKKMVESKYTNPNDIHHWEAQVGSTKDWHVVQSNYPSAISVTNWTYEERVNESKRRIKLISKPQLDAVLQQYSKMFE